MHISKEQSVQNCWSWTGSTTYVRATEVCTYAPLDLGFHPVDSGPPGSIQVEEELW